MEDVRSVEDGQRGEVAAERPAGDADAAEVQVGVDRAERLQGGHLVVEHPLGEVLAHLELAGRSAARRAGAVDDDDREALVGQPLVGGERPGGMDDTGVMRAAVGGHDDGQSP